LLYSSASDFQFRYAPVTVILGYKNQRDAWWQNKKPPVHQAPGALNKLWLFIFKKGSLAGLTSR